MAAAQHSAKSENLKALAGATIFRLWQAGGTALTHFLKCLDTSGNVLFAVDSSGNVTGANLKKTVKVALTAGVNTGGGILSWANPETFTIIVDKVELDITTGVATLGMDLGTTAVSATTAATNLMSNVDVHTAGLYQTTGATALGKIATGKWVTGSTHSGGDSTGVVGSAYITYHAA